MTLLKEYQAAGSLAQELPYWGWLGDDVCLTRSGELLSLARLTPVNAEGLRPEQIDQILDRWQRALSSLDPDSRLYCYFLRRPISFPATHGKDIAAIAKRQRHSFLTHRTSHIQAYLCWTTNPHLRTVADTPSNGWRSYLSGWLAGKRRPHESVFLYTAIQEAHDRFRQMVAAQIALLNDLTPLALLNPVDGSKALNELINRPATPWGGGTGSGLNWRLSLSELEAERRHLRLDGEPVVLYSLLSPPVEARAELLSDLYRLDATLTVSLEWRPAGRDAARRRIVSARRHYFNKRYSLMAHWQQKEATDAAMADTAAEAESARLGDALVELEADGVAYGEIILTIALHGPLDTTERMDGELRRIFNSHDAKLIKEGYGQLPVWFGRLPAQPRNRQIRTIFASAGLAASMAPIFGPPAGQPHSTHLDQPALAVLQTRWHTPYHYDLFAGDVGHTLLLGSTGSGKSFLLNFILVSALQYNPKVLILDLGGSYRWLTRFLEGNYLELSPRDTTFRLRPFDLPNNQRTYQFLAGWITRLLKLAGYDATGGDPSEIQNRIKDLYALPAEQRTLSTFAQSLPSQMWDPLSRWHGGGAWGQFFDRSGPDALLTQADWQVVDLAGAAEHQDLCEAALFYLLERLRLDIESPEHRSRLKIMIVDEAWRFLKDPAALGYLAEAAKTWRKHNAALVLATQSATDITQTPGAAPLLESLPTTLFLANPSLPDQAADTFRLNDREAELIRSLIPKRELYLRRPDSNGILQIEVDPRSYWLYTSSHLDAEQRDKAVAQYGLTEALNHLARGNP